MKIRIQRSNINSVPSAVIHTTDWSRQDLDTIVSVGEPSVDIGGKFWKCRRCEDSNDSNDRPGCLDDARGFFESLSDTCEPDSSEGYEDTDEYFVIPSSCRKIRNGFPILMDFSQEYFKNPEFCAKVWADEMAWRIALKVRMLRFVGTTLAAKEEVYDV